MSELLWVAAVVFGLVALLVLVLTIVEKITGRKFKWPPDLPKSRVEFDEHRIKCEHVRGVIEEIEWSQLQAVVVRARTGEPFWLLYGTNGGCLVPMDSDGAQDLLIRLQQLPGFDNRALIQSLGGTSEQDFVCWERKVDTTPASIRS